MIVFLKKYPVTSFLVGLTTFVFLVMQVLFFGSAMSPAVIFQFGGMYGDYVKAYPMELWRLVSPIFVHIGWEHFLFNTVFLCAVGQYIERFWGSRNFLLLYLLAGIMGNEFTLIFTANVISAGASTALSGLSAAMVCLGYSSSNPQLKQLGKSFLALIVVNFIFSILVPNVGIIGHIGGLIGGALAAFFLKLSDSSLIGNRQKRFITIMCYLVILMVVLLIVFMA